MELLKRAGEGDLDGVKRLIQEGADVNTTNSSNQTALYCACEEGHTKVAQYLLNRGASVDLGAKPLIVAVRNRHFYCVKLLLEHNADVNCSNTEGESPMSVAILKCNYSIILLLLEYGAVPSASLSVKAIQLMKHAKLKHTETIKKLMDDKIINLTSWGVFRECFSFAFKRGSVELAERMLETAVNSFSTVKQLYSDAVYYSAKNNWPAILSELLQKEVDINQLTDGQTPLYVACKKGHESVVNLLLNNGADPNMQTTDFSSPLQIAVQRRNVVIVDMLLGKGANLNHPRERLLHIVCSNDAVWKSTCKVTRSVEQTLSMIRLLLQQGVDVNAMSAVSGDTALYRACAGKQLKVVQILLEAGADVNLTSLRRYPLIAACKALNIDFELINLLVRSGADVKCVSNNDQTCLHAIINAYLSTAGLNDHSDNVSKLDVVNTVKLLLDGAVDVNAFWHGKTALYLVSQAGDEVIVRLLLEAGAETDNMISDSPLYAACERGYTQIVDLLLQYGADSNASSVLSSGIPICCALMHGHTDIVYLLLKHGADVNKPDQSGKSALRYLVDFLASQRCETSQMPETLDEGSLNMLKSMLVAGGDVNTLSQCDGWNALHIASSFGMCDVMTELIQHGANCKCLTTNGKSALDLACEKGHEAAMELLLKNGAMPSTHSSGGIYSSYDSPLHAKPLLCTAAMNSSEMIVILLLKHGADVNASDEEGNTALHLARSSAITEMLLNAGANVNATNYNKETALSLVCENRCDDKPHDKGQTDVKVIEMLLRFGADPNTCSPLYAACKNNDIETVRLLLSCGADANLLKSNLNGSMPLTDTRPSPLCIACKNGNALMVACLLTNGAAVTFADNDGNTPLHFAIERFAEQARSEDYDPIVTVLLQHNAAVNVVSNSGESLLYAACKRGLTGVVKQLLVYFNAEVNLTVSYCKKYQKYPLMIACEKNFSDLAMMLLDRGADANVYNDEQTPLILASVYGNAALVKHLLICEADVNMRQNNSATALHAAVVGCKILANRATPVAAFHKIVKRLLKNGAEANAVNNNGETPLCLACRQIDHTDDILREYGADPNLYPPCDRSCSLSHGDNGSFRSQNQIIPPLSDTAAAICGNSELVMLLIRYGARPSQTDQFGRTALHYAVEQLPATNITTVDILLSAGADANVKDATGATPLYLACDRGMTQFVRLLLSQGASSNGAACDKYPIIVACKGLHYDSVKLLLEFKADVTVSDEKGKTALHHALEAQYHGSSDNNKRSDLVQLLLDEEADTNAASKDGETPFYVGCSNDLFSVVAKMLKCGAKVNENKGQKLPLIAACRNKHVSVVQLLLINGADPNIHEEGHHITLPLHIAAAGINRELVQLLLTYGAGVDVTDKVGNTALHHVIEQYPRHHHEVVSSSNVKAVLNILLENKADVNIANRQGVTPLNVAASRKLLDIVSKMLQKYGGDPNKGSLLADACRQRNVELVDILLKHGADPNMESTRCNRNSKQQMLPLFIAVKVGCDHVITLLLSAGASVNMVNNEGLNILCFAAEQLLSSCGYYSRKSTMRKKISTVHLLLQHGANFNMLDGHSPLYLVARHEYWRNLEFVVELLQLMVKHGAMLTDKSVCLGISVSCQSFGYGLLMVMSKYDVKHKFIVHLLQAGAGFMVIATFCDGLATSDREVKSICLCQAVVLAGYSPSDEELQNLQFEADDETEEGGLLEQLLNWLIEDRREPPSLVRQCRIAIRRQLSEAVHHQTIIPAIDQLPLPKNMKLYLQFAGVITEVDLQT